MTDWRPFINPIILPVGSVLWLMLPLCLSVAVVHKTLRMRDVGRIWFQVITMMGYMVAGLIALAVVLWLILAYWDSGGAVFS